MYKHKGPIEGWKEHFDAYIKSKVQAITEKSEQYTFEPKINRKSKKLMEGQSLKVEDRLLQYG